MARMDEGLAIAILRKAIHEGHAVTLSFGGQPILAEPYTVGPLGNGALGVTYLREENGRIEQHQLALVADATDLGRSLDAIRTGRQQRGEEEGTDR